MMDDAMGSGDTCARLRDPPSISSYFLKFYSFYFIFYDSCIAHFSLEPDQQTPSVPFQIEALIHDLLVTCPFS